MAATIIEAKELQLPANIQILSYAPDFLVIQGPGLTREQYQTIKAGLPAELQSRLAGWRRTGR